MPSRSPLLRSLLFRIVLASSALLLLPGAHAQEKEAIGSNMPVKTFDGWRQDSSTSHSFSPADAAALAEYGLKESSAVMFARSGRTLHLLVLCFPDATGAYGAFTYFRAPDMHVEKIGEGGAASGTHYLFWTGATLIEANFDRADPKAALELNDLASALPKPKGPEALAPALPNYLPARGLENGSVHYSLGPAAYAHSGGVLSLAAIQFERSAEVVSAEYHSRDGRGTLTLINYPTPQIALDREHVFAAALKADPSAFGAKDPSSLLVRRAGPLLAITTGQLAPGDAHKLLDDIHYNAGIVWSNTLAGSGEARKTASLLLSIAYLTIALTLGALVLGVFFGGGRALLRILRGKPVSTLNDEDFISLKLGG